MSFLNPISPIQVGGQSSVSRESTFGTTFSNSIVGGYMQVNYLTDLIYTIPTGTTGNIEYSGNTIPINFIKGTGSAWSPNVLTLNSDNLSSGRRKIGMLVYVYEEDQIYQFHISGYTSLWNAATASTGTVTISDFGTTINNSSPEGQSFINAWSASTIEGVNGYTSETAVWRKFNSGTGGGGSGFTSVRINNVSQFTSGTNSYINFSGNNVSISYVNPNTLVFSAGTSSGGGGVTTTGGTYSYGTATFTNSSGGTFDVTGFTKYFVTGSTPTGYTLVDGDRWFDTNSGLELVWITDGDGSQWVQPTQGGGGSSTGNYLSLSGGTVTGGTIFTAGLTANTISATTYQNLPFSGTVGGTGTSNYVTKWSDGINITDSVIYDDGSLVGINTTTPIYNEPISFQTSNRGITIDSLYIQENSNGSLAFATSFDYNSWGTGGGEIAIGTRGPLENSTGSGNIGIGDKALNANTSGIDNLAIGGTGALANNLTGGDNIAIGRNSLFFNDDGLQNVAIGNGTLYNNITGDRNTVLGNQAGYSNLSDYNVYIGHGAGYSNDGSNNIFIGYSAGGSDTSSSNKLNIGDTIIGDLSAKSISVPTISATTYQNLPSQSGTGVSSLSFIPTTGILTLTKNDTTTLTAGTFTYITGGSYSNNIVTLTNNLGGNSTLTINTLTGLTINGGLTVTTISATTYQNLPFSGTVTGSGTTRYIPSWNSVSNLVNSIIYNATDKIGINTSLPSATLHVSGDTIISSGLTATTIIGNSLTLSNSASTISLNNPTQQQIKFFSGGTGTPTYNSYSSGAKIIFSDNISSISSGFAIGVDAGTLWYGADLSGNGHDWYAGTRKLATLVPSIGFQLIGLGSTSDAAFTISGNTVGFSKGGAGYTDFLRVINNATGATNTNKWFRMNSTGGIEILNSVYTATIFSLSDNGIMAVGGGNTAAATSQDATSNYLTFNNNNTQIYDDGNTHIHSRGAGQSMWINTNGGQLNLLTQSPTSTGGIGSGIAIATGTLNGYVTINTGRTVTTAASYGYLTTGGAGTYPGGAQTISISLYANERIWGQEIDAFSDERMKNIEGEISLEDGIKLVKNLKPIKYTWKKGVDKGLKAGYSAQQVIKSGFNHLIGLIPTEGLEETIDDDGFLSPKDTQFAMNYDQVTPYHGVVIKHLLEKIEQLESRIKDLENK